jgi:hypothetical protein
MHSGFLGHSRNDSITGSLGATAGTGTGSPLASPKEAINANQTHPANGTTTSQSTAKATRRSSGWKEVGEDIDDEEEEDEDEVEPARGKGKGKGRAME